MKVKELLSCGLLVLVLSGCLDTQYNAKPTLAEQMRTRRQNEYAQEKKMFDEQEFRLNQLALNMGYKGYKGKTMPGLLWDFSGGKEKLEDYLGYIVPVPKNGLQVQDVVGQYIVYEHGSYNTIFTAWAKKSEDEVFYRRKSFDAPFCAIYGFTNYTQGVLRTGVMIKPVLLNIEDEIRYEPTKPLY